MVDSSLYGYDDSIKREYPWPVILSDLNAFTKTMMR